MFEMLTNLLAGGAAAVEDARHREDHGARTPSVGGFWTARTAHEFARDGAQTEAAWLFGVAGEKEGRHNHWLW